MNAASERSTESPVVPRFAPGWSAGRIVATTLTVALVALAFYLAVHFQVALLTLVTAMMFRVAVKPLYDWLRARGLRASPSALILFGGLCLLIVGVGALIAPIVSEQFQGMVIKLPLYYKDLRSTLNGAAAAGLSGLGSQMPNDWATLLPKWNLSSVREGAALDAVAPAAGVVSGIGHGMFLIVATFMMTVYWTMDGERVTGALLMRAHHDKRDGWRALVAEVEAKIGGYFRGQLILCGFIAVLSSGAYLLMGLPYALVLGLIAGIFEVLPMIGPVFGMVLPLFIALATSPGLAIWVVIAGVVIQQVESNLLVPRVMDKSVGVSPIISTLAIAIFSASFGLVGALLAIPVAAVLQILLGHLMVNASNRREERALDNGALTPTRGALSLMRLEARELVEDVRKLPGDATKNGNLTDEPLVTGTDADSSIEAIEDQLEAIARDLDQLLAGNSPETQADYANSR